MKQSAVEWFAKQVLEYKNPTNVNGTDYVLIPINKIEFLQVKAKEIEKEQRGYSEEEVRLAYFQGEKDSYVKGGQTKEMENEFIQSLQQKHELNKSE